MLALNPEFAGFGSLGSCKFIMEPLANGVLIRGFKDVQCWH